MHVKGKDRPKDTIMWYNVCNILYTCTHTYLQNEAKIPGRGRGEDVTCELNIDKKEI